MLSVRVTDSHGATMHRAATTGLCSFDQARPHRTITHNLCLCCNVSSLGPVLYLVVSLFVLCVEARGEPCQSAQPSPLNVSARVKWSWHWQHKTPNHVV